MKRQLLMGGVIAMVLAAVAWVLSASGGAVGAISATSLPPLVVSSARDAGPDTLRDAILAADRMPGRASIVIRVARINLTTALPALINPHGIELEADSGSGLLEANGQESGAVLQIDAANTVVRGLQITGARSAAVIINAPGVQLDGITVQNSKLGVLLQAVASGSAVRDSRFLEDETGVMLDVRVRGTSIVSTLFRGSSRAGVWFVGADPVAGNLAATHGAGGDDPRLQIVDSVFDHNQAGVVLANAATLIRRSRFLDSVDSAVLVLSGPLQLQDSEIRRSGGTAVSVNPGSHAVLSGNQLDDNRASAILSRDSDVQIEHNTLEGNVFGIVVICSVKGATSGISDNVISGSSADAITVIGGAPLLQRNRLTGNRGAGVRALDTLTRGVRQPIEPHLVANVLQGNGLNDPVRGVYRLGDAR